VSRYTCERCGKRAALTMAPRLCQYCLYAAEMGRTRAAEQEALAKLAREAAKPPKAKRG
jgi:late competence protein required for DNA uptake (superfamily II DNA/RNA helicase)